MATYELIGEQFKDFSIVQTTGGYDSLTVTKAYKLKHVDGDEEGEELAMLALGPGSGIPAMYTPHPLNIRSLVRARSVRLLDTKHVEVEVTWAPPDVRDNEPGGHAQINIGAVVQSRESQRDITGAAMRVLPPPSHSGEDSQTPPVAVQVPNLTFDYRQAELDPPGANAKRFVGKLNSVPVWGDSLPGGWLCTGIVGTSVNSGATYEVTYSFQWLGFQPPPAGGSGDLSAGAAVVAWTDDKGDIPDDATLGAGYATYQVSGIDDFRDLGSWVTA